uniref:Uncharacterized protein n=1 Tax=mine drainage metagenome TaxID=410659 RepID=E6QGN6_9ZZZZ
MLWQARSAQWEKTKGERCVVNIPKKLRLASNAAVMIYTRVRVDAHGTVSITRNNASTWRQCAAVRLVISKRHTL